MPKCGTAEETLLQYTYNVTYDTVGVAFSSSGWVGLGPDSAWLPQLRTEISPFWGGTMDYNEIRSIVDPTQ